MPGARLAILADIHGNLPALRAVINDLKSLNPDEVLVGGDMVGRGPQGLAVVREIRRRNWPSVRGNHEDYLLSFRRNEVPEGWLTRGEWAASRWMAAELDDESEAYLASLPFNLQSEVAEGLSLVHGSPRSHSEGLGTWTSDRKIRTLLEGIEVSVLACAHTHRQMHRWIDGRQIVNVGSVGLPFNGDTRAQYALFTHEQGEWSVDLRRVEYDLEETIASYRSSGFDAAGGVTAHLLRLELLHAAPFLVPFLHWAEVMQMAPCQENVDAFLDIYDPGQPVHEFFVRINGSR